MKMNTCDSVCIPWMHSCNLQIKIQHFQVLLISALANFQELLYKLLIIELILWFDLTLKLFVKNSGCMNSKSI